MSTWKEMSDEQLALLYADGNNKAFDILLSRVCSPTSSVW